VVFRLGGDFVAARDFPNGQPVFGFVVFLGQLFQDPAYPGGGLFQRGRDLRGRKRLVGDVHHSLHHGLELRIRPLNGRGLVRHRQSIAARLHFCRFHSV
jgi:hypothetical protein